jgi:hypothetical protein
MKYIFILILIVGIAATAVAGGQGEDADAVTRPTQAWVTSESELQQAAGPEGPWIILFEDDLEVSSDVAGEVYEEEGADAPRRKFALYSQDENRNVTDRYTLTVPNLIVRHENVRIQGGTIDGDVYVEAEGFELRGATIDGNLYFENESLQESFEMDDGATVTGETAIGSM